KTLLLKRLQNETVDDKSSSIPTVGTNIYHIQSNNVFKEVREIGGTIAPLWSKYYKPSIKIHYVVDAANLCQISAAGVLLYTILTNPECRKSKVMLMFTKMDVSYRQMRNEALLMLHIDRLRKEINQSITIVETSALTGEGIQQIVDFLK
ncbi:uncharacterized protein CBL_21050, partial [Carabus blaptoides fortunei]